MEHINRLPDQTRGIYWLVDEGATFDDIVYERARRYDQTEISLPITRVLMEKGAGETFDASALLPTPAAGRTWVLAGWCSRQEFDTPTRELGAGQYNITGPRSTYGRSVTWYDGATMQSASDSEVILTRDGKNAVVNITRKPRR